jgi:hypothetical protein
MSNMNEDESLDITPMSASADAFVPRFCTNISTNKLNNGLVLSMLYHDEDAPPVMIARVVIDMDHAAQLRDVLDSFINGDDDEEEAA